MPISFGGSADVSVTANESGSGGATIGGTAAVSATVNISGTANLSLYGKRQLALAMYDRGRHFLGASILLRRHGGPSYVVVHLFCQGAEIILKSLLLLRDYDSYKPKLKKVGHNLEVIMEAVADEFGMRPARQGLRDEVRKLNSFYKDHYTRYASPLDLLIDPSTIEYGQALHRLGAVLRLMHKRLSAGKG
jgi:hypothetical protein